MKINDPGRLAKGTAAGAFLILLVGGFEGLSLVAYKDPVGILTVCYGETAGVRPGDRHTLAECKDMLAGSLKKYIVGVSECVKVYLPDKRYAALVSFAYNLGVYTACRSSVVRLINEGKTRQGCDALLKYNRAGGIPWSGLTRRRQQERALCLEGA